MSIKELKDKYGVRRSVGAVNAAIRAEIIGGGAVLDAMTSLYPATLRSSGRTKRDLERTLGILESARKSMVEYVSRKYDLKTRWEGAENDENDENDVENADGGAGAGDKNAFDGANARESDDAFVGAAPEGRLAGETR